MIDNLNFSIVNITIFYCNFLMSGEKVEPAGKFGRAKDVVSEDRNWVYRINGQLGAQHQWSNKWGYLSKGFSPQKTGIKQSIDHRLQRLQQEVQSMNRQNIYQTSSQNYGKGDKMEIFANNGYNIIKNKDLRPLQRRLPKNWKKEKWKPPVDPFDPLSNMNKKK